MDKIKKIEYKNVLVPITSFRINQISQIWLSPKIQGTQKTPPDFNAVSGWIVINKDQDGKFSTMPDKLVTDLIVVVDSQGNKLGYLNKLFNFTYVINLEFELSESIDVVEKETSIDLWIIYQVHAEKDLTVHPNFLSIVATAGKVEIIQTKHEQYMQDFAINPLIKEDSTQNGRYLFKDYNREGAVKAFKSVIFPSVSDLSSNIGVSFSDMRIGFNFLEGFYIYKIIGNRLIVLTPRSRQRNTCNCYIFKSSINLDYDSRVFNFAGNFYLVSKEQLIVLYGSNILPSQQFGYSFYDYTDSTVTKVLLDSAVPFEFSHIGDIVINKSTNSLYSVLYEQDINFDNFLFNEYYTKYIPDGLNRIKTIYNCVFDNWKANNLLSANVLLGNRWCLFKHKASGKIMASSNYPSIKNRIVFSPYQPNFPRIDNDYLILKDTGKILNINSNVIKDFKYIDMYLGNRLFISGGQFIIC